MRYVDCIRIETIVGGISVDKQLRLLRRCPDILVATPGRLWHFIQQVSSFYSFVSCID